jgi:hypothetical protein
MALPTLSSRDFKWKGKEGSAPATRIKRSITTAGFYIKSARTGALMLFLYDNDAMERNEFFDGEAHAFMSPGNGVTVTIWTGK